MAWGRRAATSTLVTGFGLIWGTFHFNLPLANTGRWLLCEPSSTDHFSLPARFIGAKSCRFN
jgi:hypothetical protein